MKNGFKKINIQTISTKIMKQKFLAEIINNEFISKRLTSFDVSSHEIEQHLSFLIVCIEDTKQEMKCREKCKSKLNGFWNDFYIDQNMIYHTLRPCKCLVNKKGKWADLYNNNLITFPKEFLDASFKHFDTSTEVREKIMQYFNKFMELYPKPIKGLFLMGANDWGKTYALAAFANELFNVEKDIMILNCKTNFEELRDSNSKEYFKIVRDKYKRAKILIVDGLGEERAGVFNRDYVLRPILKHRFDNKKHTIFSSRYKFERLYKEYSKNNNELQARALIDIIQKQTIPIILTKYK